MTALAEQGYAPRFFSYIDRAGRPLYSTLAIIAFAPLAYVSLASSGVEVFDWLLALSGLAALFTWGSICVAHIRFRSAWKYHGHSVEELPFTAIFGVWGSWLGLTIIVLVLIAQVCVALPLPLNGANWSWEGWSLTLKTVLRCHRTPGRNGLLQVLSCPAGRHVLLRLRLCVETCEMAQAQRDRRRFWSQGD